MKDDPKKISQEVRKERTVPTVSRVFEGGRILELVYDPGEKRTRFVIWEKGSWETVDSVKEGSVRLIPYSSRNNLISHNVVLLPSGPEEYGSDESLISSIRSFIHRYVQVTLLYEKIASYYVLLSWIYDGFNELPYLRIRGDYGSGKTRFLTIIGSLCYKPIFASGASTVSPLFRILDIFRGTLLIDEADFRLSDEKAEVVKILNNGNVQGFPVLRSEVVGKEYNPRAYQVFGPKIVATRSQFEDRALESRFLTEESGGEELRDEIPINLPSEYRQEALRLRNKLLLFRFRNLHRRRVISELRDRSLEPRLNQIFLPLLSVVKDRIAQEQILEVARKFQREIISDRGSQIEAQVLEVILELTEQGSGDIIGVKDVTSRFIDRFADEYDRRITTRWIGSVIRKKLGIRTHKSHGVYVLSLSGDQLARLGEKYGLSAGESG